MTRARARTYVPCTPGCALTIDARRWQPQTGSQPAREQGRPVRSSGGNCCLASYRISARLVSTARHAGPPLRKNSCAGPGRPCVHVCSNMCVCPEPELIASRIDHDRAGGLLPRCSSERAHMIARVRVSGLRCERQVQWLGARSGMIIGAYALVWGGAPSVTRRFWVVVVASPRARVHPVPTQHVRCHGEPGG